MPRRSTGCERCRQRKVRCDEDKPGCKRCISYGIKCPGYRILERNNHSSVDQQDSLASHLVGTAPSDQRALQCQRQQQLSTAQQVPPPTKLNNQPLHRVQLLSTFLDLYLPQRRDRSVLSHFQYISHLPSIDLASPLLQISVDTLCLAEIGSLYQDDRLLQESRSKYVRALPMLSKELARPAEQQMPRDHILAVITILAVCELFDGIAGGIQGSHGWISHVTGAQHFIKAMGPEVLATPFGQLLFHQIRHSASFMGLSQRKAILFAEPQWLGLTATTPDPMVALYDIFVQIPGLLERADAITTLKSNSLDTTTASLTQNINALRTALSTWYTTHHTSTTHRPYQITRIEQFSRFTTLLPTRTFQTAFDFASAEACTQLQIHWLSSFVLDSTLLALNPDNNTASDLHRTLYVTATSLCRSLPFCCDPAAASPGRMSGVLLATAQTFFARAGYCAEWEWCRAVRGLLLASTKVNDGVVVVGEAIPKSHGCRAAICNFRVECLAPAPLSLERHYRSWSGPTSRVRSGKAVSRVEGIGVGDAALTVGEERFKASGAVLGLGQPT